MSYTTIERLEAYDFNANRDDVLAEHPEDSPYPRLCGVLNAHLTEATQLARELFDELTRITRKKDSLEWAAEQIFDNDEEENYELLYATAQVVENALKRGMDNDSVRERLKKIQDDEIAKGCFINDTERCVDCKEFCEGIAVQVRRCEECQEIHEESLAQD